jgi:hypothetical protein
MTVVTFVCPGCGATEDHPREDPPLLCPCGETPYAKLDEEDAENENME